VQAAWRRQVNPGKIQAEGFLVDAHSLVLGTTKSIDVFRGLLVVLSAFSNSLLTIGSSGMLEQPGSGSLLICNAAASQCFAGWMAAFGYSAYTQFLRVWPDPPKFEIVQVLKTMIFPLICAWIISFTWRFLAPEHRGALLPLQTPEGGIYSEIFRVLIFQGNHAGGPDLLLASSLNFALVFALWRPVIFFLDCFSGWTHDFVALLLAFLPLLICLMPLESCGHTNWIALFWPCGTEKREVGAIPGMPHLMDFNLGLCIAVCWDRFLCQLRPYGNGNIHLLPWETARRWFVGVTVVTFVTLAFFVPLGQVIAYVDLFHTEVNTPLGVLQRGPAGGPSTLWMLSSLWPVGAWAALAVVLVSHRGSPWIGSVLTHPLALLEHFGANVLYYIVVVNVFLAGLCARHRIYGHANKEDDTSGLGQSIVAGFGILCAGRFLHFIAKTARK